MNKNNASKKLCLMSLIVILLAVISINFVYAETPAYTNVCCEKTSYGAWCQNNNPSACDVSENPFTRDAFRVTPTSCDATSYCRQGCCYDSKEGLCMENTPQLVCQMNNGTWADSAKCEIPQCSLGCCVLDNEAAFVTLVRCKKLSSFYGVQTDFRKNIQSESACVSLAQNQDRGACVYEEDFIKTCKFTTRGDCSGMNGKKSGNTTAGNATFYKDYLCSAEELATNCGPTKNTICVPGKDEVYFKDSCGNPGNIYDSSKYTDNSYWKKVVAKKDVCGFNSATGSANSASCGNCDYFGGSYCQAYDKTKDSKRPTYGDNVCRDLDCKNTQDGNDYKHGESWCVFDDGTGKGKDPAGSRYWKHICVAGEEIVEPCGDYRSEICIQDKITTDKGDFQQAACRANRWQDCVAQKAQKDCENLDKRDCQWIENAIGSVILGGLNATGSGSTTSSGSPGYQPNNFTGGTSSVTGAFLGIGEDNKDEGENTTKTLKGPVCVPDVPPGLKFWNADSQGQCGLGNAQCEVQYEAKGFFGNPKPKCIKNCECLESGWNETNQKICRAVGDCSPGTEGVYKYLQEGNFGITGTGLAKTITPFANIKSFFSGLVTFNQVNEDKSLNEGLMGK